MVKKSQTKEKPKKGNKDTKALSLSKEIVKQLLQLIGIKSEAQVSFDSENDCINIDIKGEDEAGLLIGKKGETVNSLQKFISLSLRKETGQWHRVIVNVADWREKQRTRLEELASQAVQRVRETGELQNLYNLTPGQRRIIHLFLSNEKDIKTESVGEGKERYLVISLIK